MIFHSKKHSIDFDSCVTADTIPHTAWVHLDLKLFDKVLVSA